MATVPQPVHNPQTFVLYARARIAAAVSAGALVTAPTALGQDVGVVFSVDWRSGTVGSLDSQLGTPITEGDLLLPPAPSRVTAFGPLQAPSVLVRAGPASFGEPHLGLNGYSICLGHAGGTACVVEVDALSSGSGPALAAGQPLLQRLYFSTDRFAVGFGAPASPGIASEAPLGDLATDVLVDLGLGQLPAPPFAAWTVGSVAVLDGDGLPSGSGTTYRGVGLRESDPLPDDLDALAFLPWPEGQPGPELPPSGLFLSLDAGFIDPLTGLQNSGSADFHGVFGADVLRKPSGAAPLLYAPAAMLGLDLAGPGTDDLDALVVCENGQPGFQASVSPFDWSNGASDMLLFSVRRGSAVIGEPDSLFGLPIEPGDVLTTPLEPSAGGLSPYPAILIAAENLGLFTGSLGRSPGSPEFGDDLDALELASGALSDCNGNGRDDAVDIALGSSADTNGNGIPDECERDTNSFCECAPPPLGPGGPCGNHFAGGGCRNSTGAGAVIGASGTTSVLADDLVLSTTGTPPFVSAITFASASLTAPTPFFAGRKCLGAPPSRFSIQNTGPAGQLTLGPGLATYSQTHFPAANCIASGATLGFQTWYRDPTGPCSGQLSNLSNAVRASFTP